MNPTLIRLWTGWKKIAHAIGVFQTRLFLNIFYILLLWPLALVVRGKDPLKLKFGGRPTGWTERETRDKTLEDLTRQS